MELLLPYLLLNLPFPLHKPDTSGLRDWPVRMETRSEPGAFGNPRNPISYREFFWNPNPSYPGRAEFVNHIFSGDTLKDGTVNLREFCEKHLVHYTDRCPDSDIRVDSSLYGGLETGPSQVWNSGVGWCTSVGGKLSFRRESPEGSNSETNSMFFYWAPSDPRATFKDFVLDSIVVEYLIERERTSIEYDSLRRISRLRFDRISTGSPKDPTVPFSSLETFTYFGSDSVQSERVDSSSSGKRLGQKLTLRFAGGRLKSQSRIDGYDVARGLDRRFETAFIYADELPSALYRLPDAGGMRSPHGVSPPKPSGWTTWDWVLGRRHAK